MEGLDLLKKDWKKQEANYPKLSYDQIYNMLWKRSSSVVKWIFVISIIELFAATLINIIFSGDEYWKVLEEYELREFTTGVNILSYLITFGFIYVFYRNYRKISSTDDAATLMKNILRTRRTVKIYIAYVLISTGVIVAGISAYIINFHIQSQQKNAEFHFDTLDWIKFLGISTLILAILLCLVWLFYRVVYGILLKRLKENYKELKKLES